ncbi:MAG: peptidoglycan DD-metalloendopeptidase family protein [Xanthobacteraceae bacterium]|nr:peptidoglycan DD-metalloendopeptidase family protein [Xanthobacteraceae bacterium]
MAYQSSYGSGYSYPRDSFGQRRYDVREVSYGVSRPLFIGTLLAAILFALWSGATTFYLVFHDEILRTLATRQLDETRTNDAQIASLSTEVDLLRSTKFVDQEKIERQLSDLLRLQKLIEARHNALAALTQAIARNNDVTGSLPAQVAPLRSVPAPTEQPAPDAKPRPLSDTYLLDPPLERSASLQSRVVVPRASAAPLPGDKKQQALASVERTLTRLGAQQAQALNALEAALDERTTRTKKAIAELGVRLPRTEQNAEAPVGGPFIPYSGVPADTFMRQVFRIRLAAAEQERIAKQLEGLPVQPPVRGDIQINSSFGPRLDPFLRRLAFHSGTDLRGEYGDPVLAAAAGTVIYAGRHNAYGNMVEIDHGNGLTTRYAHLSAILVKEGAVLAAGAVVGKIGSTGRSTGPHLHFEVRVNGDPVDPRRYLRAARQLAGAN